MYTSIPKKHPTKEKVDLQRPIKILPNGKIDRRGRPKKIASSVQKQENAPKEKNEILLPEKPRKVLPNGKIDRRGRPRKIVSSEEREENADSTNLEPEQYCHLCGKSFKEGNDFKSHIKEHLNGSIDETSSRYVFFVTDFTDGH